MAEAKRSIFARAQTFMRFVRQQRGAVGNIIPTLHAPDMDAALVLTGQEADWRGSGHLVRQGERFRVTAQGHHWIAKPLGLVLEPRASLYMRIGGGPVRKIIELDGVYVAWADGEVEFLTKCLSEFANERGMLLPGKRRAQMPGISVEISESAQPETVTGAPHGWRYLWRLGDGRIYTGDPADIQVATDCDVGILQSDVDIALTPDLTLNWDWLVEALPSQLPEDLPFTHDYLSIAVEFDNGRDLTYMWSSALPPGHVFRCPLDWWCERETHWVLRSGIEGLGQWHSESQTIADDYLAALGDPLPSRIVRIWLIANSVFQRTPGKARFANIAIGSRTRTED